MLELGTGIVDGGELNFVKSFLQFNIKKKIFGKGYFKRTLSIWLEMLNTKHC